MLDILLDLKPARRTTPYVPEKTLEFGHERSEHMFLMDYAKEEGGWHNPRIVPYGPLPLMPGANVLNYGQGVFEGLKAFKHGDGEIYLFRPDQHVQRLNCSAGLMCIPQIPEDDQLQALDTLVDVERLWFPEQEGATFYLRPLIFGDEDALGVNPSKTYTYCVFISPSGPYYKNSQPLKLWLTSRFHRVPPGGVGNAKAVGNYGGSLFALEQAHRQGASQVLYLDVANQRIEETGASNHCHVTQEGEIVIPSFTDTILSSVTARSLLSLEDRLGHSISQRSVFVQEYLDQVRSGEVQEAGIIGTAVVVGPVGSYLLDDGRNIKVGDGLEGPVVKKMRCLLTNIQAGREEAPAGWLRKVPKQQI